MLSLISELDIMSALPQSGTLLNAAEASEFEMEDIAEPEQEECHALEPLVLIINTDGKSDTISLICTLTCR